MTREIRLSARGKVNLSLNITGVRGGMHTLDSILCSIGLCDTVHVSFRDDGKINVRFAFPEGIEVSPIEQENSVTKAVRYLQTLCPTLGADVTVEKGIPLAGGLGGSSADAAAVIAGAKMCMPQRFGESLYGGSVCVGSDVPAMCVGGSVRLRGVGEQILSVAARPLHLVIANRGGVSSKEAFGRFDELYPEKKYCPTDTEALLSALSAGDWDGIAKNTGNALTQSALRLCPEIAGTLSALREENALAVFMTGSGSCCCGLYADETSASKAAERIRGRGIWAVYTATQSKGVTEKE